MKKVIDISKIVNNLGFPKQKKYYVPKTNY